MGAATFEMRHNRYCFFGAGLMASFFVAVSVWSCDIIDAYIMKREKKTCSRSSSQFFSSSLFFFAGYLPSFFHRFFDKQR